MASPHELINKKYMQDIKQMEREAHQAECANEDEKCEFCADTEVEEKTNEPWTDRSEYDEHGLPNE